MSVGKVSEEWKHTLTGNAGLQQRPGVLRCKILANLSYMRRLLTNGTCYRLITKHQHSFLSGRSTASNLLETLNDLTLTMNNKK